MSVRIEHVQALEILDSRGNPTVQVSIEITGGLCAVAAVPSGASTGENEALELRDTDAQRYGGKGTRTAVANVHQHIAPALVGMDPTDQPRIDALLRDLDGTQNKERLGANAILGASLAAARAGALASGLPLYRYLGGSNAHILPVPMLNVLNGGKHAQNNVDFQEFMIVPAGAPSFAEALRYAAETFSALRSQLRDRGYSTGIGDEGGFAPELKSNEEGCEVILAAIEAAGYAPGRDIFLALDPAASSFGNKEGYELSQSGQGTKSSNELVELYHTWAGKYPLVSIEDGLAEDDWKGFVNMTRSMGDRIQIVGDDLFVTNTTFIERGIEEKAANAVLIKPNQIGTVSETIEAIVLCRRVGWRFIISHRSGETADTFIADLAVAMGGGQIKAGSVARGERVAKYNRLLGIEHSLGDSAVFARPYG